MNNFVLLNYFSESKFPKYTGNFPVRDNFDKISGFETQLRALFPLESFKQVFGAWHINICLVN